MIAQARAATTSAPPNELSLAMPKPVSPRLAPMGSPSIPITPLELENDEGYLGAGSRTSASMINNGLDRERNLVENLIGIERRRMDLSSSNLMG